MMREAEGEAMVVELSRLLDVFESNYLSVCTASGGVVARLREKNARQGYELLGSSEVDEVRVAQEVALLAQRSDITEELARLRSHIDQFRTTIGSGEAAIGVGLIFFCRR